MNHLIIIADILLHVAGLSVVTDNIANDAGIKIIMPRVHYTDPEIASPDDMPNPSMQRTALAAPAPRFAPRRQRQHVQDHFAAIIYKTGTLVSATHWPVVDLQGNDAGYSYALLDGDYVRFNTAAANVPATLSQVALPHLQTACCQQMTSLKPQFLPPYQGASAVLDISEGVISTCDAPTGDDQGRLDTEIRFANSDGFFVVSASTMKLTKELRFKVPASGDLEIITANLPVAYLLGNRATPPLTAPDGRPHFYAYYDMGGGQSASCNKSLQEWATQNPTHAVPCQVSAFSSIALKSLTPQQGNTLLNRSRASNFECSNSQWP